MIAEQGMMLKQRRPNRAHAPIAVFTALLFATTPVQSASEMKMVPQVVPFPLDSELKLSKGRPQAAVLPQRSLSLQACFDKAAANNREIVSARYSLPVSKAAIEIARAIPNPHFTFEYGFGPEWNYIIAGQPQQFGWQFDFQTAGKRSKQVAAARANYGAAELQLLQTMFDVHNRTRRAYAEQSAAEAYAELIEAQRNVALDLVRVADKRFQAGKSSRSDLLQAQLGVLQLETQRSQAQGRLQQASAALSLITGELPQQVEIIDVQDNGLFKLSATKSDLVPSPERPLPPLQQLIPLAIEQRPDLKVQVQQKFADRKSLTVAKSQRIPDVFVDTGYQFTSFRKFQPYGLFTAAGANNPSALGNVPGCYFNVTAETPIFYQHQGEIAQARATWLQDFDQIKQLRAQIAADSLTAYESVMGAQANIFKFKNELIPAAAQVAQQAFLRYQVGKADLASAILARQQYQQILSSYFDSVVSYQNAWADLEKAIGVSLRL